MPIESLQYSSLPDRDDGFDSWNRYVALGLRSVLMLINVLQGSILPG